MTSEVPRTTGFFYSRSSPSSGSSPPAVATAAVTRGRCAGGAVALAVAEDPPRAPTGEGLLSRFYMTQTFISTDLEEETPPYCTRNSPCLLRWAAPTRPLSTLASEQRISLANRTYAPQTTVGDRIWSRLHTRNDVESCSSLLPTANARDPTGRTYHVTIARISLRPCADSAVPLRTRLWLSPTARRK